MFAFKFKFILDTNFLTMSMVSITDKSFKYFLF